MIVQDDELCINPDQIDFRQRLYNELWKNPSATQKLSWIQEHDAKCTLKAYQNIIEFLMEEMNGYDHDEICDMLFLYGPKEAFALTRQIYIEKRNKKLPKTTQHILYHQLADFLKKQFYAFMGYDPSMPLSTKDFYALQEEGEKELAQLMELSSADAAGNLVFLSIDRLSSSEIAELIQEMNTQYFTITLHKIKRLIHRRNY